MDDGLWDSRYPPADAVSGYAGDLIMEAGELAREEERRDTPHIFGFGMAGDVQDDPVDGRYVVER